ncbi:glycoside hydrolase/deacetylase [Dacryopinax primogenitus]|uniref:chitin deacetylase n=1 Tax=Dacryopinax primogenitus (strain DJM 731) TaxID=1858805 RepID=M5FX02_DACPD|nr:glycoside hydrolase/deacetylase [Dacryopinax primogenitus]EJT97991.1 glycoside hydrolase/deacetylase [Dacryopinax primogenitus]
MRSLALLLLPLAATARMQVERQATSTTSGAAPTDSSASSAAGSSVTAAAAVVTPIDTITPTFLSTNPTAEPLSNIIASPSTDPTYAVFTSFAPGATPPISGAPPLPSGNIIPADWPALDVVPPTDSPQVQQWLTELNGISVPNLTATLPGGCETNPTLVGDPSRCWWTCGECTRETDITTCPDKMTWGLSYDDGPTWNTPALLNYLQSVNLRSTFFVVGSRAISRPQILQDEYMLGHQVCVHTWSHPYLTTLTTEEIVAELGWTREAMRQIIGVSPNCMRPPYGDIDDRVRAISMAMGMTPIIWTTYKGVDFDTNDWHIPAGTVSANDVLGTFQQILTQDAPNLNSGFIVLEHDLYQQTVDLAVGYVLPNALASGLFQIMPIIECLHKPLADSYVETNNNQTNPPGQGYTTLSATESGPTVPPGSSPTGTSSHSGAERLVGGEMMLAALGGVALLLSIF